LLLVVGISVLFLAMVRRFLVTVFLAAIFAGLAYPLYTWLLTHMGNRRVLASAVTVVLLLLGLGLPLGGFLAVVAAEAVQVAQGVEEWIRQPGNRMEQLRSLAARIPFADRIVPQGDELAQQIRDAAGRAGSILWGTVSAATRGTASFLFQLFVLFYALFFFLVSGRETLEVGIGYMPLSDPEKEQLLERFLSVTRATLKGSLLIGVIQGGAAGLGLWIAGVPGPALWGAVMVVLSILPVIGAPLVWLPAVAYLLLMERWLAGILLFAWCAIVVGSADNLLRPRLIGKDARMSDLLILLSTLGGIALFGAVGFIVGPIVAALFVTVWHIYGEAFSDWLPATDRGGEEGERSTGP
jgi:predicted PurR-regulated permease PerM